MIRKISTIYEKSQNEIFQWKKTKENYLKLVKLYDSIDQLTKSLKNETKISSFFTYLLQIYIKTVEVLINFEETQKVFFLFYFSFFFFFLFFFFFFSSFLNFIYYIFISFSLIHENDSHTLNIYILEPRKRNQRKKDQTS